MALTKRSAYDGVGVNKKDDALPYATQQSGRSKMSWISFRRRRLLLGVVAILTLFFFVRNIPTDLVPVGQRYNPTFGSLAPGHVLNQDSQQHSSKQGHDDPSNKGYDGSVQFNHLAQTLRPHLSFPRENSILFALLELRSASSIIPIACEMAHNNRSTVHVALLGKQEVGAEDLMKVNGVSAAECPVFWHDARPDHHMESSRSRIETSVQTGFGHCVTALRPQAAFVDDAEHVFSTGEMLAAAAKKAGIPLITLPSDAPFSIPWITTLDGSSLRKLNEIQLEIVIQAYSESAGALVRLLRSIESANYNGLMFPHITIEVPADMDSFASRYLSNFRWPPGSDLAASHLSIRRRINPKRLKPSQASLRTIESFYPQSSSTSHVLLLSPDAELSPNYLHYLVFTLLEYKYGRNNQGTSRSLFGISLELPDKKLDDEQLFVEKSFLKKAPLVLTQSPNSNAALIMGDKWIDFHTFLTQRFMYDPELESRSRKAKFVSQKYPAWMPEAVDLMQTQGLFMLYPTFASRNDLRLVTLHKELHQFPEEYMTKDTGKREDSAADVENILKSDILLGDQKVAILNDNVTPTSGMLPMQALLVRNSITAQYTLPMLDDLPMHLFDGKSTDWPKSNSAAVKFADEFSLDQGGCQSLDARDKSKKGRVDYLFCDPG